MDNDKLYQEVKLLRIIAQIQAKEQLLHAIEDFASTTQRRKFWILCNGEVDYNKISSLVGVTSRSVQYFINDGVSLGLLELVKRGVAKRTLDLIPIEWNLKYDDLIQEKTSKEDSNEPGAGNANVPTQ